MHGTEVRIGDYVVDLELTAIKGERALLASHVVLPRQAQILVPDRTVAGVAERLIRQACILEAMSHPGVPRMYECGVLADRRPWIAIEIVDGPTVTDRIAELSLPLVEIASLLGAAADILDHAHGRGIVHSDLCGRSIVYRADSVCIVGWGSARLHDSPATSKVTRDRIYRAPEQLHGDPIEGAADIYALGVIAHQALSRGLPARGKGAGWSGPVAEAELTTLIEQMLEHDPADRPTAADVRAEALRIVDLFAVLADEDIDETRIDVVEVDLVDLSDLIDVAAVSMPNRKIAWTPANGYEPPPPVAGAPLATIVPRRRRM